GSSAGRVTSLYSGLSAALPTITTSPSLLPLTRALRVSIFRPALGLAPMWHFRQVCSRIGRMSLLKSTAAGARLPGASTNPAEVQRALRNRMAGIPWVVNRPPRLAASLGRARRRARPRLAANHFINRRLLFLLFYADVAEVKVTD